MSFCYQVNALAGSITYTAWFGMIFLQPAAEYSREQQSGEEGEIIQEWKGYIWKIQVFSYGKNALIGRQLSPLQRGTLPPSSGVTVIFYCLDL